MNRQAVLLEQEDRLPDNDLKFIYSHSLLGSHIDQDKITKQDSNVFNHAFRDTNSHDDIKQFQENKSRKSTFSELINDNNNNTKKTEQFHSLNDKQENVMKSHHVQSLIDKICQLKLTKHDLILIILNILMILTLLIVYKFLKKSPQKSMINIEEILLIKRGNISGGPGGEHVFDDAEIATLTFNDTITRVTASQSTDLTGQPLLLSLTFTYSNGKKGKDYGGIGRPAEWEELNSLELTAEEYIDQVIIYEDYRKIINPWRKNKLTYIIVGIYFETNRGQKHLFGSDQGTNRTESPNSYFLGYVHGKAGGHIDSLRLIWYKYCLKNSSIIE